MAADVTAVRVANFTATANTYTKVNLTGGDDGDGADAYRRLELLHHGNVTTATYYKLAASEAGLGSAIAVLDDEVETVAAGERLQVPVPRGGDLWIGLINTGAVTMSLIGLK